MLFFEVALLVSSITSFVLYQIAREQVRAELCQRLGDIVSVAARDLDGELHASITPELGMASEPFQRMRTHLQGVRDSATDLKYVYTLRRGPDDSIRFVVDACERHVLWIAVALFFGTLPLILLGGWWGGRGVARPIPSLNRGACERLADCRHRGDA